MQIECTIKRKGGTEVPIEDTVYHFAPQADEAHVATVKNPRHQQIFLNIPEAYRQYGAKAAPVAPVPAAEPIPLLGSSVHPASFEIHGKTYQLGDVVALAHLHSGLEADQWNALADEGRADLIDEQLDRLEADLNGDGEIDNSEERAALVKDYEARFGKKPHGKWNAAKIREALAA